MKSMAVDLYKQQSNTLHEWIKNNHEKENSSGKRKKEGFICQFINDK